MTTLADVAQAAGVSKATASLVLSGKSEGRVTAKKADRVKAVARELGYVRDALAGSMRNGRTHTIGVIGECVLSTPYAVAMVDAVLATANELGWSVLLTDSGRDGGPLESAVREMRSRRIDRVVLAAMFHRLVEVPEGLDDVVVLNGFTDRAGIAGVVPDEEQGAREAVEHLIALGHTRIGYVAHDSQETIAVRLRAKAVRDTLAGNGLEIDETLMLSGPSDPAGADDTARRLLDRPDRPTAVFCYNDGFAAGVYRQAARLGLSIPEDLSVVGFDDLTLISTNLDPPLTTMRLPHREMAEWVTRRLAEGSCDALPAMTRFACPLVPRASTAPPGR